MCEYLAEAPFVPQVRHRSRPQRALPTGKWKQTHIEGPSAYLAKLNSFTGSTAPATVKLGHAHQRHDQNRDNAHAECMVRGTRSTGHKSWHQTDMYSESALQKAANSNWPTRASSAGFEWEERAHGLPCRRETLWFATSNANVVASQRLLLQTR